MMAFHPKRIMLASDFREGARAAEIDSALIAGLFGAEVQVVHAQPFVWQSSKTVTWLGTTALKSAAERLKSTGTRVVDGDLLYGSPAECILHAADAAAMDLIVIGAGQRPNRTGLTAETVARFARQAVWISRRRADVPIERILCGVDGSRASEEAARDAVSLATTLSAKLVFAHVLERFEAGETTHSDPSLEPPLGEWERASVERVDRMLDGLGTLHVPTARKKLVGRAGDVLRQLAIAASIDLVIVGRVGAGGLRRVLLGGTAERLLRELPCGLLLASPAPVGNA
jgi:nucleotide-binding universal stress UspA family protein